MFHLVIFDRVIFDAVVRMQYYRDKKIISPEQQAVIENYYLLPWNKNLFDLHICLVADPEVSIQRELARVLTRKHGKTMNPKTLAALSDAHKKVWERLNCAKDARLRWHRPRKRKLIRPEPF